jgi:hypothetical protein
MDDVENRSVTNANFMNNTFDSYSYALIGWDPDSDEGFSGVFPAFNAYGRVQRRSLQPYRILHSPIGRI